MRFFSFCVFTLCIVLCSFPVIAEEKNTALPEKEDTLHLLPLSVENVDSETVRETWLEWINTLRTDLGRDHYILDPELINTAQTRANYLRDSNRTSSTHTRKKSDWFWNTASIVSRFAAQNVQVQAGKFTESNGRGSMPRCTLEDCSEMLIKAMRGTYTFFASEAKKKFQPHRLSMVATTYTRIGVGIAVDPQTKRYFLVMHVRE